MAVGIILAVAYAVLTMVPADIAMILLTVRGVACFTMLMSFEMAEVQQTIFSAGAGNALQAAVASIVPGSLIVLFFVVSLWLGQTLKDAMP